MTLVSDDAIADRLYRDNYKTIRQYVDILVSRGVDWGLIGPREIGRLWERHILNSIALESLIPEGCRVADVGSGAGLPGIPLAILRPDLEMTLIEPMLRRSNFLTEALDELGLDDIHDLDELEEKHMEGYNDMGLVPPEGAGTFSSPILIPSRMDSRQVGYVDPETHAMFWFTIQNDENAYYIKDLGLFFKMLHIPDEEASAHH